MAKLKAATRRKLPAGSFAYPKTRSYPIDTKARARSALARASSSGNKGSYQHVAQAVRRKYGNNVASVGSKRGTTARPGYRTR